MLNYSIGGLYLTAPAEAVMSATSGAGMKGVVVSFVHPESGLPVRILGRVTRVEAAHDDAKQLRIGLRFEDLLPSLAGVPESEPADSVVAPSAPVSFSPSSFSDSLGFVMNDGVCGRARVLSISRSGVSLAGSLIPSNGTKLKLLLEVDGMSFEVEGSVQLDTGASNPSTFSVQLNIAETSRSWELYSLLLDRASETETTEMTAIRTVSD
jgi:hypothetical protein